MKIVAKAKHILVVDDNPGDIFLFQMALENVDGIDLHTVTSVLHGNAFLRRNAPYESAPTPDLLFLDLRLPVLPGYTLLPTIRDDPSLRHITVVVFTSSESYLDMKRCKELGADDYLVKPLDWTQWQAIIVNALAKHAGIGPAVHTHP